MSLESVTEEHIPDPTDPKFIGPLTRIQELSKERPGTTVCVLYTEAGKGDDRFIAFGQLNESGLRYGQEIMVGNGVNEIPCRFPPSEQHHTITIPKDHIVDYFVVQREQKK